LSIQANPIGEHIDRITGEDNKEEGGYVKPRFTVENLRNFKPILSFLNAKDRDILYLIFVSGKKQKEVQDILGRSQPSLCYDIKRIRKRLKFIFYLNSVFDIFINFISSRPAYFDKFEIEVLLLMFYTSSFSMVADILSTKENPISQVKVRYCFDKCLRILEENQEWESYEIFLIIRSNLNLVRRLYNRSSTKSRTREIYVPQ
jgi:hypothetical protein